MNRYDIRNKKTLVITHSYTDTIQRAHLSEWGLLERLKWKSECTAGEIADAIETIQVVLKPGIPEVPAVTHRRYLVTLPDVWKWVEDCTPEEITQATQFEDVVISPAIPAVPAVTRPQCRLPQTYEVVVTDLTADETAEALRKSQIQTLKLRLKALHDQPDLTAADVKEMIMKYMKMKVLQKDL